MKSELLTTAYAPLKRNRQNSLATSMTSTGKVESKMPNAEDSLSRQVTLAAAFHDHISCTKSPDMCQPVLKEEKAHMPCETDHIYANCSSSAENKPCVDESQQRLKDMLLLQLDLIQHQQEQLAKKDRQLQTLRQEKEALKVRLERMERRMSLLKQRKELASTPERSEGSQSSSAVFAGNSGLTNSPVKNENKDSKLLLKAAYKRSHGSSNSQSESSTTRSEVATTCLLEPTPEHPWSTALILPKTEPVSSSTTTSVTTTTTSPSGGSLAGSPHKVSSSRTTQRGRGKGRASVCTPEGMHTQHLYPLPLSYVRPEPELARVESSHIEVPRWRFHAVTSCYQLEGTENLDDEIFLRRHHKLEIDEKRRKRWDMQRIREQRHNEKLRRGRAHKVSRGRGKDQADLNTFFPEPRDVQYVEVSETVPVVAFGYTVPMIPSSEFTLDWCPGPRPGQRADDQGGGGGSGCASARKHSRPSMATTTNVNIKKEP